MARPDPWDAALSVIRSAVDDLGAWLAVWSARREPDAHARRCAGDAVNAVDAALLELHGIRAQLIGEIGNTLTILAEQRVAHGVADPWALRLVGAATGTRTAGKRAA